VRPSTLRLLRCPFCGGELRATHAREQEGEIVSAVLACACGEVPLLGGIPVFRREGRVDMMMQTVDAPLIRGPAPSRLLDLIRRGEDRRALMLLLAVPPTWVRRGLEAVELLPEGSRARPRRLLEDAWARSGEAVAPLFLGTDGASTAADAFDYYFRRARRSELYHHFRHRFAQPRHLSGLALAALLPRDGRPVLDLACGFGHTLHYWTARHPDHGFVGLDRNFFELYVARSWIAPGADYVCADADGPLPFPDAALGGAFCADAFHYFVRKRLCVGELLRAVGRYGAVLIARVGNRDVEPREGYELAPAEYGRLFEGSRWAVVPDRAILARYLAGLAPDLSGPPLPADAAGEKWLSIAAGDAALFRDHGALDSWPHAAGVRRVHSLYREVERAPDGGSVYALEMPSKWFAFENGECREYMPESFTLGASARDALERGANHPELDELVRRAAVVGFPARHG
jgi:SAM-dependent methyltransferase